MIESIDRDGAIGTVPTKSFEGRFCEHYGLRVIRLIAAPQSCSYDGGMQTPFRAIVELGCQCGERLELPFEDVRTPFECPSCEYEHVLGDAQIDAIEEAFGRALVQAHHLQAGGETALPAVALRH